MKIKKDIFNILAAIFCTIILNSCAMQNYDYYYGVLETKSESVKKDFSADEYNFYGNFINCDTISKKSTFNSVIENDIRRTVNIYAEVGWNVYENDGIMSISCDFGSRIPAYVDPQLLTIEVQLGDSLFHISSEKPTMLVDSIRPSGIRIMKSVCLAGKKFPSSILRSEYTKYKNNQYEKMPYEMLVWDAQHKKDIKKNDYFSTIEFTEENSPLKIKASVTYYVKDDQANKRTLEFNFYQSKLMKKKNIRENDSKGVEIGLKNKNENVPFYIRVDKGKAWGWPEMRRGIGYTVSTIVCPVTWPINVVAGIINTGDSPEIIPYPIFE